MTDWLAFGEGLMGGRIGKGVRAERGGVKIPGSSGKNGFWEVFIPYFWFYFWIGSLRYLKVTSNYSYSREVGKCNKSVVFSGHWWVIRDLVVFGGSWWYKEKMLVWVANFHISAWNFSSWIEQWWNYENNILLFCRIQTPSQVPRPIWEVSWSGNLTIFNS